MTEQEATTHQHLLPDHPLRKKVAGHFRRLQASAPNWKFNYWGMADEALDAIPDGWAKIDGEWIRLRPRTPWQGLC